MLFFRSSELGAGLNYIRIAIFAKTENAVVVRPRRGRKSRLPDQAAASCKTLTGLRIGQVRNPDVCQAVILPCRPEMKDR
jgi:hypothetical protein